MTKHDAWPYPDLCPECAFPWQQPSPECEHRGHVDKDKR